MLLLSAQYTLSKARVSERTRLESVLAKQERRVRQAFVGFVAETTSERTMREVRQYLERNDIQAAMKVVNQHVVALGRVIPQAFTDVAGAEAKTLATRITNRSRVAIGFDASNQRAAQLMRQSQLQFVSGLTNSQAAATRKALATTLAQGGSVRDAARAFRNSIGLTESQLDAVESYRAALERNSAQALGRALRDRRFDSTVERAVESGELLETSQINRMVDRYREQMLSLRAETIARTESLGVVSAARHEATTQLMEQVGFGEGEVTRTWRATQDKRTRDSHADMDGQTVGLNEPFVSGLGNELMYPGDQSAPAGDRINCRCTVTIGFTDPDE